jgi:hypothetical protein
LIFIGRGGKAFLSEKFVEICRNLSKNVKKFENFDWKRFCQRNLAKIWQKIRKLAPFWHDFLWEGGKKPFSQRNLSKFVKKVKRFENWRHFGMIFIGGQTENVSLSEIG